MHSYNKCKDMEHLFIICGAVYASCISRNPFKALSIHVNHNECVFFRTSSSFRVSCYQIVLSAQDVFYRALACLILNQYNNKIPKAINTITNYRKLISATICDFVFFPNVTAENHPPTKQN